MSTRRPPTGQTWDDAVADATAGPSQRPLADLDLPAADPPTVRAVLDRTSATARDWEVVLPLHAAVLHQLEPDLAERYDRLQAEFAAAEAEDHRGAAPVTTTPATVGASGTASAAPAPRAGVASGVVLLVLMVSAWLVTLGAMRQGFDGVTWTWVVAGGLLVSLVCAGLLATPRMMARPVAADWGRGTGFGLVAIASSVLLGSVLFRLYGGSSIALEILPQFVILVAVPVVATAGWLLLRDRGSAADRRAAREGAAAADAAEVARVDALEERLDAGLATLYAQVPTADARRALAVELAAQRRLHEDGRLSPDVARTAASEAARRWSPSAGA